MKAAVAILGLSLLAATPEHAAAWGGDGNRTVASPIVQKQLPFAGIRLAKILD